MRMALFSFSVVTAAVSALLILQVQANPDGDQSNWISALASPVFIVPNDVAFLAVVSPISIALFHCEWNLFVRVTAISAIALSVLAISIYQSRTGFLTMLISTGVCVWFIRPRLAVIGTALVILLDLFADGFLGFPLLTKFETVADFRFTLWLAAWNMFLDAPLLGHGPYSFGPLVTSYVHDLRRSQWVDATLYLERRDGVYADDAKKWSRVQFGREDGALGPLATRGVVEGDWSGVW